jgi:hypothetical protein
MNNMHNTQKSFSDYTSIRLLVLVLLLQSTTCSPLYIHCRLYDKGQKVNENIPVGGKNVLLKVNNLIYRHYKYGGNALSFSMTLFNHSDSSIYLNRDSVVKLITDPMVEYKVKLSKDENSTDSELIVNKMDSVNVDVYIISDARISIGELQEKIKSKKISVSFGGVYIDGKQWHSGLFQVVMDNE